MFNNISLFEALTMVKIELLWRPEQRVSIEIKYDFSTSEFMCRKFFPAVPDT